jgi:hypothetical protein
VATHIAGAITVMKAAMTTAVRLDFEDLLRLVLICTPKANSETDDAGSNPRARAAAEHVIAIAKARKEEVVNPTSDLRNTKCQKRSKRRELAPAAGA